MENKREEIESRLIELKQEKKQLKKQLKELPSLEVGKWYKSADVLYCLETLSGMGYGFDYSESEEGEFFNDHDTPWIITGLKPATDQEVETALIAEAKKRGFKEGVEFRSVYGTDNPITVAQSSRFSLDILEGYVFLNGMAIFNNGKWAEIIKPKTVHIPSGDYTETQLKDILNNLYEK